jgi:outer membrane protein assembly factor BamB
VLAEVLEMNGDKYGRPSRQFRKGHVTKRTLDAAAIQKTKTGFVVTLPSRAPVATPAVYKGKIYVSGGFRSKEFYAFEATTGKLTWGASLDDDGPSAPACDRGICVFNTESCTIFAVDADTGEQLWSWWLGDPLTSAPTIADGRVFTSYPAHQAEGGKPKPPGATHALAAFDLKTGEILWQKWIDSDVMSAPVASGDFLYIATFGGTVAKLEQDTGTFRYAIRARATSAPVVINAGAGEAEQMYYTRRVDNAAPPPAAGATSTPAVTIDAEPEEAIIRMDDNDPKTTYETNKKKAIYLDGTTQKASSYGEESQDNDSANGFSGGAPEAANADAAYYNVGQASVSSMQAFQGSRILHLGTANVNTMGDEIICTDSASGEVRWKYKIEGELAKRGGFLATAPLAAGDSVLVATLEGKVLRVDPSSGKVKKTYDVGAPVRSQPVVVDGWIYVGTEDGKLVAIDTRDKQLTGWAMWGKNPARTGVR